MKVQVLASGSKGNVTIVTTRKHNILIDAGLPLSNIIKRVDAFPNIDIMIITHTHVDHVKGIKSYISRYNPKIYTKTNELKSIISPDNINYDDYEDEDVFIKLFDLSHDTPCCGVKLTEKPSKKELVYITDTGYINKKILDKIINKDMYIIESNHDIEKLRNGNYPFFLKQRILGDKGHLSNEMTSNYLKKIIGEKTKTIILAHLSQENNTKELAENEYNNTITNKHITLMIATQDEALKEVEV